MAQLYAHEEAVSPWVVLGLKPGCPEPEVKHVYDRLLAAFAEENFMESPQSWVQAHQAYMAIDNAFDSIVDGSAGSAAVELKSLTDELPPKLGQLLVASGTITLAELEAALKEQEKIDLPLGEILRNASLVTQMELDNFLLNQKLIKLPGDSPYHIGQRLIGLGLVTEDMVRIALVEQRTSGKSIGRILVERGWIAQEILNALLDAEVPDCCRD